MKLLFMCLHVITVFVVSALTPAMGQTETENSLAQAIDPVNAVLDAFERYDIVALDEGEHNNVPGHEFRLALLQDPRFPDLVDDIVVESGNSLYQELMDRFITGEEVPDDELRKVWEKTTQEANGIWDSPIYEEFYRAVRKLNESLSGDRQIRILLGDPPVDRENQSEAEYFALFAQRDSYPAEVIQRDVLAKSRRALVIYGSLHLLRHRLYFQVPDAEEEELWLPFPTGMTLVELLESGGAKVFSVRAVANDEPISIQPDVASWQTPSLALINDTVLGLAPYTAYLHFGDAKGQLLQYRDADGRIRQEIAMPNPERSGLFQDQFDAILTLGLRSNIEFDRAPRSIEVRQSFTELSQSSETGEPEEAKEIFLSEEVLEKFVGKYPVDADNSVVITLEDGQLMVQPPGFPSSAIFPRSETSFFHKEIDVKIDFQVSDEGLVEGMKFYLFGMLIPTLPKL